jgi:PTH1 family peptidyl-tRNA hydrolase
MNESGRSVGEAMRFYKLAPADVVVIHDEIDLAPGKMRTKLGGGVAGHNGLRDIAAHIGRDFHRVRIGVGHPGDKDRVKGYVLSDFAKADRAWLEPLIDAIAEAAPLLAQNDAPGFATKVALILNPPAHKPAPEKRPSKEDANQ